MLYKHDILYENDNKATCKTNANLAKIMAKRAINKKEMPKKLQQFTNKTMPNANFTKPKSEGNELHIEALVVLDNSMVTYHKEFNIENYVLTVFNMVCIIILRN